MTAPHQPLHADGLAVLALMNPSALVAWVRRLVGRIAELRASPGERNREEAAELFDAEALLPVAGRRVFGEALAIARGLQHERGAALSEADASEAAAFVVQRLGLSAPPTTPGLSGPRKQRPPLRRRVVFWASHHMN